MKLNASLFICLFFSAIVAIKAANDYEEYNEEYEDDESTVGKMPEEEYSAEEEEQDVQEGADYTQQEPQQEAAQFQYMPSKRLEEMEKTLPSSAQAFIPDGKAKETFTNTFNSAMATDVARTGFDDVQHQWKVLIDGPEAPRVVGTVGQNINKVFTSPNGSNMINMLATTTHVLLAKTGEEKIGAGLAELFSLTYSLLTSDMMPDVINKTGGLVITAVNKPKAPLFVRTYWDGIRRLFNEKNLNDKINKYFTNIMSMMKSMSGIMQGGKQQRRKRNFA